MRPFAQRIKETGVGFCKRRIDALQVNMGRYCNQACIHCHVEAGPGRKEMMGRDTVDAIIRFLEGSAIPTVDITGGAPELNPNFDYLVKSCVGLKRHVIDRCNLTVLFEPGKDYLPEFLRENRVELVCSLPCYLEENVKRQRGDGTCESSIRALQLLNRLGYGVPGTGLTLHLVYNPLGAYLPPPQERLEQDYKRVLQEKYGIVFNRLYCLTNAPIRRFDKFLKLRREYERLFDSILKRGQRQGVFLLQETGVIRNCILTMCTATAGWYSPQGRLSAEQVADQIRDFVWTGLKQLVAAPARETLPPR